MVRDDFRDFVLDQLRRATPLPVTHRAMFGAVGVYAGGCFFAIVDEDVVYFKVDEATRPDFEARGSAPFLPYDDPDRPMRGYWRLPDEVLEDAGELAGWVERAVEVARRADARKKPRR